MRSAALFSVWSLLVAAGCGASTVEQPPTSALPSGVSSETPAVEPSAALLPAPPPLTEADLGQIEQALVSKNGPASAERARRGLAQVAERWRAGDGDAAALRAFALEHFLTDEAALRETAEHLERSLEMIDGHMHEIDREAARYQELEQGAPRPVDALLAAYSPAAHVSEDLFGSKVAFVALLNFPVTTLEERLGVGKGWSRDQWALARLTGRFEHRLPAEVHQEIARASAAADAYIDSYNISMDHLVLGGQSAGFEPGQKLISHWGLRDEIRALYAGKQLAKQRLIQTIMERIIEQDVPAAAINSDALDWDPMEMRVRPAGGGEWTDAYEREPDRRYEVMLGVFRAHRAADRYYPDLPTHIDRMFQSEREMPEARMRELLVGVMESPQVRQVAALIGERLGRPLEPFDLWYAGFRAGAQVDEAALSEITRRRYPTAEAFQQDIPRILSALGFSRERARFLAERIVVEPARGAGHATGAQRRDDSAHLRTRVAGGGMDYKGFNIAIHELGHNVEQVISMSLVDHTLLEGVPNTGFTEAFAFLFQARDLELLGRAPADRERAEAMRLLDRFWSTYEISGVALLDIEVWHWLYDHPEATAAELRSAMITIAQDIWNRYYAEVFGTRDQILLAIYSHLIAYGLYTPDYPLGFIITTQVEQYLRERSLAEEMERMCRLGQIAPDLWMEQALGAAVSNQPLIDAASAALQIIAQ